MHPFSGGTSLCRPLEGVYSPRGSTRAHGCLYLTMSWSFQHFLSFHITFYQTSHWTSFSFKTFVSDESIHGKPDTLDTFALRNPRQSCILDSICRGFRIPGTAVRIPIRLYMYSGIQDYTAEFPGFRNQSTSENFPESGILIPLHGANTSPGLPAEWSMQSVSLLASLIVNRSPLSVKRIPGFVFAFKTNARHSILCLDYNSPR